MDPTISFLSSPGSHISGLVYLLLAAIACSEPVGLQTTEPRRIPRSTTVSAAKAPSPAPNIEKEPASPGVPWSAPPLLETLPVEGFHTTVYVPPKSRDAKPHPVTIVLHGNFDRPEWQCDTWRDVAASHGWVLCPRGVPTPWAEKSADRWMYRGADRTLTEIDAALTALSRKYNGYVDTHRMVLAGFSLGAILASPIAITSPNRFTTLFLIEGGLKTLDKRKLLALKRSGVEAIGLAMSSPKYRAQAKKLLSTLKKLGIRAQYVDMAGAGHNYHPDFPRKGATALRWLLSPPSPSPSGN